MQQKIDAEVQKRVEERLTEEKSKDEWDAGTGTSHGGDWYDYRGSS